METTSSSHVSRSNLPGESRFLSGRPGNYIDASLTHVVTCSSDVSRVESTSSMVLTPRVTHARRSSVAIPNVDMRPEREIRQEPEMDNPAEIQVSMSANTVLSVATVRYLMSAICEEGSGATRPSPKLPAVTGCAVAQQQH